MIGDRLGSYVIDRELGSGGMGKVYAATDEGGARVALKIVHPHLLETPGFFKRFLREAEVGKAVRHPNVVRTFDCDQLVIDGVANSFLVMEYVEGQTLRDLLDELDRVPEELCRHIGREVAKGLQAIHDAGIVHRDMKPENVLITEDHVVKVMDLGVARLQDEAVRLSQTGAFVGSLHYAAPEQFKGESGEIDGRADLHALGLLLYELASGQHPFDDEDFRKVIHRVVNEEPRRVAEINPQLSPFFEELVHCLLAKDRDKRLASAAELREVLEQGEESAWWSRRASVIRAKTKRPLRRIRIPRETALYGRDDDLARLRALYDKAKAGDGQVVLIEGEAGIGKTRLVDEFIGRLRQEGDDLNFLFGSYPPGGAATAAGAFSTAYREHFGDAGSADYLGQTPILVPAFDAVLRGEPAPEGKQQLTKDSLQTCFVHVTRALAAERPTVVLIDDLHFAPKEGRALFTSLALAVEGHAVLMLGTHRPGVPEDWLAGATRLGQTTHLTLSRLGPKDLFALLEDTLKSERVADELAGQIGRKSDGNPFFVFEILRGLREGQFITQREDGTWVSTQVIEQIKIPSSVMDLVNARISDLTEEEQEILDVAACCGFEFEPTLLAETVGMQRIPLLRTLGRIEKRHRLVRASGPVFVFDHHQVQEALYAALSQPLRREYHAAIAEALEQREKVAATDPREIDGALTVELCEHFFKGGRGEQGLRYLEPALDHLEAGCLNAQALALSERALGVPSLVTGENRVNQLLRRAGWLGLLGRRDTERAALDEALALAETGGGDALRARVEGSLAWHLICVASYEDAHEVLTRSIERARAAGDKETEAAATGSLGVVFSRQGRYEEALLQHERAIVFAREIGARATEGGQTANLGVAFVRQGCYEEARERLERAISIHQEIGHRRNEAATTGDLGIVFFKQGRFEKARELWERHLSLTREIGDRQGEANATGNLGNAFFSQGRCEKACEHHQRNLALSRESGHRQGEAIARQNLGETFARLGAAVRAREELEAASELARDIGFRLLLAHAVGALASLAQTEHATATARTAYEEAVDLARDLGARDFLATSLTGLGAHLATNARPDEARVLLEEALAAARETGTPGAAALASCHLGLLPGGDADAARAVFEDVKRRLKSHERMEARFLLWRATSDPVDLAEAHSLLQHLRHHAPEEYRDTILENVPLHRDIVAAWKEHGGGA